MKKYVLIAGTLFILTACNNNSDPGSDTMEYDTTRPIGKDTAAMNNEPSYGSKNPDTALNRDTTDRNKF